MKSDWALYVVRGGVVAVNVCSLLLLGLLMSADDFGRFVFLWSIILTTASIASIGGPQYLMREMSARQAGEQHGTTWQFAALIAFVLPLAVLAFIGLISLLAAPLLEMLEMPALSLVDILMISSCAFVINATSHMATPLRIGGHQNIAMLLRDAGAQFYLIIGATSLYLSHALTIKSLLIFFAVISVSMAMITGIWILKKIGKNLLFTTQKPKTRYQLSFWWSSILGTLSSQIDILLAGLFVSPATLGNYQILKRFANLTSLPQIIANWSVIVGVGKAFANRDYKSMDFYCKKALRISLIPSLILMALCIAISPIIFRLYQISMNAENFSTYIILLLSSIISIFLGVNFVVASQCHLERAAATSRFLGMLFTGCAILYFQSTLSLISLALFSVTGAIISQSFVWLYVKKRIGVDTSAIMLFSKKIGS